MATTRLTAAERREAVLEAALAEFAAHGYNGSSTEQIARRVGISQPYVFRLFGTKRNLFKGLPPDPVADLFARGLLLDLITAMDLDRTPEPWSERIVAAITG
jgi:AcrR family transcriptional regulator